MTGKKAQLSVDGIAQPLDLPVYEGTIGPDVVDVKDLTAAGLFYF